MQKFFVASLLFFFAFFNSFEVHAQNNFWKKFESPNLSNEIPVVTAAPNGVLWGVWDRSLFTSNDRGKTWSKVALQQQATAVTVLNNGYILAGGYGYMSRSVNNGASFSNMHFAIDLGNVSKITYDPYGEVILAFNDTWEVSSSFYMSTNYGQGWSSMNAGLPVINDLVIAANGNYVFATNKGILFRYPSYGSQMYSPSSGPKDEVCKSILRYRDGTLFAGTKGTLYKSTDSGINWQQCYNITASEKFPDNYFNQLSCDSSGTIWACNEYNIYNSTDQGKSWNLISLMFNNNPIRSFTCSGDGYYYVSAYKGIYRSDDKGSTWTFLYEANQMAGIDRVLTNTDGKIFVLRRSTLFEKDNENSWTTFNTWSVYSPVKLESSSYGYLFAASNDRVYFSATGEGYWQPHDLSYAIPQETPKSICSDSLGRIWLGTLKHVIRSTNNGNTWSILRTFPAAVSLNQIAVNKKGYIFNALVDQLDISTDGGITWKNKTPTGLYSPVNSVMIGRKDVVYIGTTGQGLFFSKDNGESWDQNKNIPAPANSVSKVMQGNNGYLYALADSALYVSKDEGKSWENLSQKDNLPALSDFNIDMKGNLTAGSSRNEVFQSISSMIKIPAPEIIKARRIGDKAEISWKKVQSDGFLRYRIYGGYDHYPVVQIDSAAGGINDTIMVIDAPAKNEPYYFIVSAVDNSWNETFSEEMPMPPVPAPAVLIEVQNKMKNVKINPLMKWARVPFAANYHLQLSADSNFISTVINDSTITDTLFQVNNLTNKTAYYWRVRVINISGKSAWSEVWSFTTITGQPQIPQPVSPANSSIDQPLKPVFKWKSAKWAEKYQWQLSKDYYFSTVIAEDMNLTDTVKTIADSLSYYTYYVWRVRSVNEAGASSWTDPQHFFTVPPFPIKPDLVSPENGAVNVLLNGIMKWTPSTFYVNYQIQVACDSSFSKIFIDANGISSSEFYLIYTKLLYDTVYYWRVKAYNGSGQTEWTGAWKFRTAIAPPPIPVMLLPEDRSVNQPVKITLKWRKTDRADKYNVKLWENADYGYKVIADTLWSDTTIQFDLKNRTGYLWQVKAVNAGGYSEAPRYWTFSTIVAAPAAPTLISPADKSKDQPVNLKLKWNQVQDAANYRLLLARDSLFSNITIDDSSLTAESKDISALREGMKYYWTVKASNIAGSSSYSPVWNFTTILPACDSLSAVSSAPNVVKLTWFSRTSDAEGYIIERRRAKDLSYLYLDSVKANALSYTDTTVTGSTEYTYRIQAYTGFARSVFSNEAAVTAVTNVSGKNNMPLEYSLMQNFPNPFNPATTIKYSIPKESYINLKIFDMLGSEISSLVNKEQGPGEYKVQFDGSSLPSGVYIYTLQAGQYRDSKKLLLLK